MASGYAAAGDHWQAGHHELDDRISLLIPVAYQSGCHKHTLGHSLTCLAQSWLRVHLCEGI